MKMIIMSFAPAHLPDYLPFTDCMCRLCFRALHPRLSPSPQEFFPWSSPLKHFLERRRTKETSKLSRPIKKKETERAGQQEIARRGREGVECGVMGNEETCICVCVFIYLNVLVVCVIQWYFCVDRLGLSSGLLIHHSHTEKKNGLLSLVVHWVLFFARSMLSLFSHTNTT